MPNNPTAEELLRRLAVVQKAIGERGWSLQIKRALARDLGVHPDTVDNYRRRLIDGMRVELDERTREEKSAEFIERLQGHQRAALAAGARGARGDRHRAAQLLRLPRRATALRLAAAVGSARGGLAQRFRVRMGHVGAHACPRGPAHRAVRAAHRGRRHGGECVGTW